MLGNRSSLIWIKERKLKKYTKKHLNWKLLGTKAGTLRTHKEQNAETLEQMRNCKNGTTLTREGKFIWTNQLINTGDREKDKDRNTNQDKTFQWNLYLHLNRKYSSWRSNSQFYNLCVHASNRSHLRDFLHFLYASCVQSTFSALKSWFWKQSNPGDSEPLSVVLKLLQLITALLYDFNSIFVRKHSLAATCPGDNKTCVTHWGLLYNYCWHYCCTTSFSCERDQRSHQTNSFFFLKS